VPGLVGHRPDGHELTGRAGGAAAHRALDDVIRDQDLAAAGAVGPGHVGRAVVQAGDVPPVGPDVGGAAGAVNLGLEEGDEVHVPVVVTRVRDAVGSVVVELGPDGQGIGPAGDLCEGAQEQCAEPRVPMRALDTHADAVAAVLVVHIRRVGRDPGEDRPRDRDVAVRELFVVRLDAVGDAHWRRGEEPLLVLGVGEERRGVGIGVANRDDGEPEIPGHRRPGHPQPAEIQLGEAPRGQQRLTGGPDGCRAPPPRPLGTKIEAAHLELTWPRPRVLRRGGGGRAQQEGSGAQEGDSNLHRTQALTPCRMASCRGPEG